VVTNPYSAEYGRSPGAAVVVSTRGGTNHSHGVLYEYFRNKVFDANDFFSSGQGAVKPKNNQNQFGGNLGAPIIHDKLFGFFNYEGTRIRRGIPRPSAVPLFPLPNRSGATNNFFRTGLLTDDADSYNGRIDWVATSSDSVFARYTYTNRTRFIPGFYGGIADGTSTSAWGREILKSQTAAIGWTHVFGPGLVNEFRLGFLRDYSFAE